MVGSGEQQPAFVRRGARGDRTHSARLEAAAQAGGAGRRQEAGKKRTASHFFSGAAFFL